MPPLLYPENHRHLTAPHYSSSISLTALSTAQSVPADTAPNFRKSSPSPRLRVPPRAAGAVTLIAAATSGPVMSMAISVLLMRACPSLAFAAIALRPRASRRRWTESTLSRPNPWAALVFELLSSLDAMTASFPPPENATADAVAAVLAGAAVPDMVLANAPLTATARLATAAGAGALMADVPMLNVSLPLASKNVFASPVSFF